MMLAEFDHLFDTDKTSFLLQSRLPVNAVDRVRELSDDPKNKGLEEGSHHILFLSRP